MTDVLILPREVSLRAILLKKRNVGRFDTSSINSDEASESFVSSLENSFLNEQPIESGFESFADFLEYTYSSTKPQPWRRRRKYLRVKKVREGLKVATRVLKRAFYGLCRVTVFSIFNICAAVGLIFFLVF